MFSRYRHVTPLAPPRRLSIIPRLPYALAPYLCRRHERYYLMPPPYHTRDAYAAATLCQRACYALLPMPSYAAALIDADAYATMPRFAGRHTLRRRQNVKMPFVTRCQALLRHARADAVLTLFMPPLRWRYITLLIALLHARYAPALFFDAFFCC